MSPLRVGAVVAAVLAGPSLYSMVQTGQMDGTGALFRGLLVAAACAVGTAYLRRLLDQYEADRQRQEKRDQLMAAIAEAEEAQHKHDEALAKAVELNTRKTP